MRIRRLTYIIRGIGSESKYRDLVPIVHCKEVIFVKCHLFRSFLRKAEMTPRELSNSKSASEKNNMLLQFTEQSEGEWPNFAFEGTRELGEEKKTAPGANQYVNNR